MNERNWLTIAQKLVSVEFELSTFYNHLNVVQIESLASMSIYKSCIFKYLNIPKH